MSVVNYTGTINGQGSLTVSSGILVPYNIPLNFTQKLVFGNGTGASQVNLAHFKEYSLTAAAQSIDLTSNTAPDGTTNNMVRVRYIQIVMLSTSTSDVLTIDMTVTNGFKAPGDPSTGSKVVLTGNAASSTIYNVYTWIDKDCVGASLGGLTSGTSKIISLNPGSGTFSALVLILGGSANS